MSVNEARGEAALVIDGAPRRLCLTLGGLAELESEFGAPMAKLGEMFEQPSAERLLSVLHILLRGGGEQITREELLAARIDLRAAANAVARAFATAFDEEDDA